MAGFYRTCALTFLVCAAQTVLAQSSDGTVTVPEDIKREIAGMADDVQKLISYLTAGAGKHQVYDRLATFTDTFGNRLAGSLTMQHAVEYMIGTMKHDGLDNVHGEPAMVPNWIRGLESATLLEPRVQNLAMLGLGLSVGTPRNGLTADVLVVNSFDELHNRSSEAKGKIVVFNQDWVSYGVSVQYRGNGASEAAKVGAIAALVRSVTPFSINSPHTGAMTYQDGIEKIPTACITVEDAQMLARMQARGTRISIRLHMDAALDGEVQSMNTVAEVKGTTHPDEIVLVSGHLDSWDVGQGAMDDGGGAFISWQALSAVRALGLRPKRTMRAVLWTGEEFGGFGSDRYYNDHKNDSNNMDIVMESDSGVFQATGLRFTGSKEAKAIVTEIMKYMAPFNASTVFDGADGTDIDWWFKNGVPGGSLDNENEKYFYFHHSNGDTMTVLDPDEMDVCAALWAVASYCIANLDSMLPR
ncbi:carboxypeptidase Q-like [Sycon ciliatum]|uniref:carboxypeptidase Q-like n=1 Tax=Sycon ciliatum TaxID=27933 RepID=UPI0031F6D550